MIMAAAQGFETLGKLNCVSPNEKKSSPPTLRRNSHNYQSPSQQSKRLSRHFSHAVEEAKANVIASCDCVIHQPINVPVDISWENSKERRDPDARMMVSSKDCIVYLYFSKLDDNFHLTVIKHKADREEEVFLTIALQSLTTGDLKYKIKNPCWHQVSVIENEKQRDFVFDLVKGSRADVFTEKVKHVLHDLEHGGVTNSRHVEDEVPLEVKYPPSNKTMDDHHTMPSGLNRPLSAQPTPVNHLQNIVDLLQASILAGNTEQAKQIAGRLAAERIKLNVQFDKEEHKQRIEEQSISVKVHVEDRETSGCPINMKVKPSDTIGDLKRRMFMEYEFPVEVQKWIIGKRIPKDQDTLYKCHIRNSGHTLYLYLTTARSVGLTRNQVDPMNAGNRGLAAAAAEASGDYMTMAAVRDARQQAGLNQKTNQTPSRQSSNLSNASSTTLSPLAEVNDQSSFNASTALRNSGSSPALGQTQGKPKGQGQGRSQHQSAPDLGSVEGAVGGREDTLVSAGPPVASGNLQAGKTPAQKTEETHVGWTCPQCTFNNKPTRPGCEMCGGDRPPDYEVPIGYIMSKEELCWLAEDEEQKRMMEEAKGQRGGDGGNDEQLTEEQLDLILRFNDALVDLQQRQGGQGQAGSIGQNVINLPANRIQAANPNAAVPRGEDVPDKDVYPLYEDFVPSDEDNTEA